MLSKLKKLISFTKEPGKIISKNSISTYTSGIASAYKKLYEADGQKEVLLTAYEADELLYYIQNSKHIDFRER